ncbi:MAG TPA: hypothetical protein VFS43_17790 [Polyangiaceae bacterium]|nr:hypothetical protein [Polyangiaceae bacterium]
MDAIIHRVFRQRLSGSSFRRALRSRPRLAAWLLLAFVVLSVTTCLEPTQLELWLSTDLPCDKVRGTAVTVGHLGELEDKPAAMSTTFCERRPDGSSGLGMLVVVPSGERDGPLALKVVTAVTASSTDACGPSPNRYDSYRGCIVARRALRYLPHDTVRLTVSMLKECEGVACDARSTCFQAGLCLPADVTCNSQGCRFEGDEDDVTPNLSGGSAGASTGGATGGYGGEGNAGEAGASSDGGGQAGVGGLGGSGGLGGAEDTGGIGGGGPLLVSQVVAGGFHSCALVTGGQVECWGSNAYGQLGDGTTTVRLTPVPVLQSAGGPPLTGVKALALGYTYSCAFLDGGQVACWGSNAYGQLGDGTTTVRLTPVPVLQSAGGPALTGVQALALGYNHSCALLDGGQVACWGFNAYGQLGDGTAMDTAPPFGKPTPVTVLKSPSGPPLTGVQALALGERHSCALVTGGQVECWGFNNAGQLGDGTTADRSTPVTVLQTSGGPPLTGALALALGLRHSCALLGGGEVRCWGDNVKGELGDGTTTNRLTPVAVLQAPGGPPLIGAQALALGGLFSCVLLSGDQVHCWGYNLYGQLGDGTMTDRPTPAPVLQSPGGPPLTGALALVLGEVHSCARMSGGEVRCWGLNNAGQLGDGTTTGRLTPVAVGLSDAP